MGQAGVIQISGPREGWVISGVLRQMVLTCGRRVSRRSGDRLDNAACNTRAARSSGHASRTLIFVGMHDHGTAVRVKQAKRPVAIVTRLVLTINFMVFLL